MKKVEFKITVYLTGKGDLEAVFESPFGNSNLDYSSNKEIDNLIHDLKWAIEDQKLPLKSFMK